MSMPDELVTREEMGDVPGMLKRLGPRPWDAPKEKAPLLRGDPVAKPIEGMAWDWGRGWAWLVGGPGAGENLKGDGTHWMLGWKFSLCLQGQLRASHSCSSMQVARITWSL